MSTKKDEIPNGWEILTLEEMVNPQRQICYGIVQTGNSTEAIVPCIRVTDIVNGKIDKSKLILTTDEIHQKYKRTILKKGDLVLALRGKIGSACIIDDDLIGCNLTRGVALIDIGKENDVNYIFQYLSSSAGILNLTKSLNGSALQELSIGVLKRTKVPIPKLKSEQVTIAGILNLFDKRIEKNEALRRKKTNLKQWLMQNLLTGKKRLVGFNDNWQELNLGKLFNERNERNTEGLTLLSIGQDGVYPQSESNKKNTSNSDKSKYKKICVGDIGYNTMRMWQGRNALSSLEGIVSPAYTIVVPKENADALFFSYLFKLPKVVHLFWRNSQGLVGDTLNCKFKHFIKVKVNVPDKDEQIAIAKVFKAVDQEIELLELKTEKLKEQKKGMMQQLLTGKKRLKIKS